MVNFEELEIFKNVIDVQEIKKGSQSRKKYKVVTEGGNYFVKIEESIYSEKNIYKIKWLYKKYQKLNIPVVPLIDVFALNGFTIWIYPFCQGTSLDEISVSNEQLESYGKKIANDIKKLNSVKLDNELFPHFDFKFHYESRKIKLENYLNNDKFKKVFSEENWDKLFIKVSELFDNIKNNEVMLNHNDIKLKNFMIDENLDYFFIDIDPFDATFVGYNLGYSISCFLFKDNMIKERTVLRSFIKNIDMDKKLIDEFNYFLICDFINKFERYVDYYMLNSSYVKSILLNENNILNDILY